MVAIALKGSVGKRAATRLSSSSGSSRANLQVKPTPLVHHETRRKSVARPLLWLEYHEDAKTDPECREPYQYSMLCNLCHAFRKKVDARMCQVHRAGEKVDYSGMEMSYFDRELDEHVEVELFVAVLVVHIDGLPKRLRHGACGATGVLHERARLARRPRVRGLVA